MESAQQRGARVIVCTSPDDRWFSGRELLDFPAIEGRCQWGVCDQLLQWLHVYGIPGNSGACEADQEVLIVEVAAVIT